MKTKSFKISRKCLEQKKNNLVDFSAKLPVESRTLSGESGVPLVVGGVQRRARRRGGVALLVVQTPQTVVTLVRRPPLLGSAPPPPGRLRPLLGDAGAVEDVDGVGRQAELEALEELVHRLFAVDELAAVDLEEKRRVGSPFRSSGVAFDQSGAFTDTNGCKYFKCRFVRACES